MKKVLVITYNFPPVGGGRVRRVLKFVKYLRDFGWEPIVLTVRKPLVPEYDPELLNEVPRGIRLIRTAALNFEIFIKAGRSLRNNDKDITKKITLWRRLLTKLVVKLRPWVFMPDSRVGWIPFAIFAGYKAIKGEKISVIFVVGEPFSSFLTGIALKVITGKPLVLDFRDEWSAFNLYFNYQGKGKFLRTVEERLESFVIKRADKVISVTGEIVNNFKARYSNFTQDKFVCITNGFDPSDFIDIKVKDRDEKFTITHAGWLRNLRSPKYFIQAVEELSLTDPEIIKNIMLLFLGTIDEDIKYILNSTLLSKNITTIDFVSYKKTIEYLTNSSVLLYIEDQVKIADRILPAKIFEYMGMRRPVLVLANGKSVKEFIQKTKCGIAVAPEDTTAIKNTIRQLYYKHGNGELNFEADEEQLSLFHRRTLTARLAAVLDSVVIKPCS